MNLPKDAEFTREGALEVWAGLAPAFAGTWERLEIAGSVRRGKAHVHDVEVVYVPRLVDAVGGGELLATLQSAVDLAIARLEREGILERRKTALGRENYGKQNKLMRHVRSGMPVDFFATTDGCWHNYLVCRTGPAGLNRTIAEAALAMGWRWNPYGPGFSRETPEGAEVRAMGSEEAVFNFVGLPYREPGER